MCAIALLCLTFRLLVPLAYTSFVMIPSRFIESSNIAAYLVLASTCFLVSESHSDIRKQVLSLLSSVHPFDTLILFSHGQWRTGTSCLTTFSCMRRFFMSDPFLNIELTERPSISTVFKYSSGPSLPMENSTHLKNSSAAYCCFLFLFV